MLKRLLRHPWVGQALARSLSVYLALAYRTTRWTFDGRDHAAPFFGGAPVILAFWHERLPLLPQLWRYANASLEGRRRKSRMHVLVSRHRDGRFIGDIVNFFKLDLVYGSSSRGGAAGLRSMADLLAAGHQVTITPDGPRGPRRQAAPGVAQLAALSGVPILPCSAQTSRRWVTRSWDRMVIPLPFTRGVLVCGEPIAVMGESWVERLPAIEAALTAAVERADLLCAQ
jgi:lysophospholipid acyltransferase (LPLAT)-like uncharacterized protein